MPRAAHPDTQPDSCPIEYVKGLSVTILIAGSHKSSGLLAKNSAFGYHGLVVCSRFRAVQTTNN